jgi:hypothetical protein
VAFDADLADRIRAIVSGEDGVSEKRMFGGLAFLIHGNMAVSASGQGGAMVRVDPADTSSLLEEPHVERVVMRGRAMDGWLRVDDEGVADDAVLSKWVGRGVGYARTLPPKG